MRATSLESCLPESRGECTPSSGGTPRFWTSRRPAFRQTAVSSRWSESWDVDGYHAFVHGQNLADLREALEKYDLIVTFNGASFDLPFIEHHFGSVFRHTAHIDLRFPLRRIGFRGGLKSIERQLRVGRPSELSVLNGYDAVRMWRMWHAGDEGALKTLIRYNAEDVLSLPKLAEVVYNRIASKIGAPAPPVERVGLSADQPAVRP